MRKILIFLLCVLYSLYAQVQEKKEQEQFQVVAKNIEYENDIVTATGDVIMFSPTYYITAQKAVYNKAKNQVSLYDNVNIMKDNKSLSISNYSFMEFEVSSLSEIVFMLYENNLWIESAKVTSKGNDVYLEKSLMSSCDCNNPDWSIRFSSGSHSDEYSWLQTFNNRLYIRDVPILYLPYFAFYTNTDRHSGLLMPTLGYSSTEGFIYMQPYYYAPADNWDVEVVPQYRAKRGNGLYAYFRYADSPDSMLDISTGYFNEKEDYKVENELKNEDHYGIGVKYERRNIFALKQKDHEDGFYADLDFLRDIEYKTLSDSLEENKTPRKVESKINYYYKTNNDYLGTYLRYYRDVSDAVSDTTQKQTIQKLPTIQYHRFSTPLIADNLLYSTDVNYTNYHRTLGLKAQQTTVSLPFFYGFSLFDDYLNISLQEEIFFANYDYDENGLNKNFEDGQYLQLRHSVTASTNLLKEYNSFLHTINLGSTLYAPNSARKKGDIYPLTNEDDVELKPFPLSETRKNLSFWLSQSFYDRDFATLFLNHKVKQSVLYDSDGNSDLGNLENDIYFYHQYGSISSRLIYNHQDDKLIQSATTLYLMYNDYFFRTLHYWTQNTPHSNKKDSETITYEAGLKFLKSYRFSYKQSYNIVDKLINRKEYKLSIDKGCWFLHLRIADELVASSTINNTGRRQDVVYVMIELRPIGGFDYEYKRKSESNN